MTNHIMVLDKTHPTGAETWECPECGRQFVVQWAAWDKQYKKIVLDEGDQHASHQGHRAVEQPDTHDPWTDTVDGLNWGNES